MEKQNPFSLYDFLGYFVPGAIFLFGTATLIYSSFNFGASEVRPLQWARTFGRAEFFLPFLLTSYVVGHLMSYLSTVTVERLMIWTIGYPSRFLLSGKSPVTIGHPLVAKWTKFSIFPVWVLEAAFRRRGADDIYTKPLDESVAETLENKIAEFSKTFPGLSSASKDSDRFRFIYHYVVENSKSHLVKLQNYVALYGFTRTLCFVTICLFWLSLFMACLLAAVEFDFWRIGVMIIFAMVFALISFLLYLDFVKFSRRFSLEALMALAIIFPPCQRQCKFKVSR